MLEDPKLRGRRRAAALAAAIAAPSAVLAWLAVPAAAGQADASPAWPAPEAGALLAVLLLLLSAVATGMRVRRNRPVPVRRPARRPPPPRPVLPEGLRPAGGNAAHHLGRAVDALCAAARPDGALPGLPPKAEALHRLVAAPQELLPRPLPELDREVEALLRELRDR